MTSKQEVLHIRMTVRYGKEWRLNGTARIAAFESDNHIADTPFSMDLAKVSA